MHTMATLLRNGPSSQSLHERELTLTDVCAKIMIEVHSFFDCQTICYSRRRGMVRSGASKFGRSRMSKVGAPGPLDEGGGAPSISGGDAGSANPSPAPGTALFAAGTPRLSIAAGDATGFVVTGMASDGISITSATMASWMKTNGTAPQ
jgi:hypothetical protein